MAAASSPMAHLPRYSPYASDSSRPTPPSHHTPCTFSSPATYSSSLPRGILRRRPPVPHNSPATPTGSVSARCVRFSNLSPSRKPRVELTPDPSEQSNAQPHLKVRGWLDQQIDPSFTIDDLVSSPLANLSLASRPSRPQHGHGVDNVAHGVHATFHPSPLSHACRPPTPLSSASEPTSDAYPYHRVRANDVDLGDVEWSTWSGDICPFGPLVEYASDLTDPSPSNGTLISHTADPDSKKKQNQGLPWCIDSGRPVERLPTKFQSPLPAGFPQSPKDSPFEELYRTINSSPLSSS